MQNRTFIFFVLIAMFTINCGTDNKAAPYVDLTDEQAARKALDAEEYEDAAELYAKVIEDDPERYDLFPIYATALAGAGGVSLLGIVMEQLASSASESGADTGVLGMIDKIVPADSTREKAEFVDQAVDVLNVIPAETLEGATYRVGVSLQKTIYSSVYTAMIMDLVLTIDAGSVSQESLENMTPEDAVLILDAFLQAGSSGDPDSPMTQAMSEAATQIESMEGATTADKLRNYLSSTGGVSGGG
jgi:hypothetical protein